MRAGTGTGGNGRRVMAKPGKTQWSCNACGAAFGRWAGQCGECQAWNTIVEQTMAVPMRTTGKSRAGNWAGGRAEPVQTLSAVGRSDTVHRHTTHIGEFDRVLGGGAVVGSVVLLGGDPGIGKSTLLIQALALMGQKAGMKCLYVTGEESLGQVAQRALRLGLDTDSVHALAETDVETILATAEAEHPQVMVLDSVQTLQSAALASAPGTVSQVRECASQLTRYAKTTGCIVFLVGHVTKSGELAGPRVLEHMVDAVLYFEGDPSSPYRLIRANKNRFGPVNELGAFEMGEQGLVSVDNPSALFLSADRQPAAGSSVFVMQEGQRALLIDVQALVDDSAAPSPRRLAVGVDANRLAMLLGVIHKHAHMQTGGMDVFVNAVGGIRATEPAADLPMCLAILSSLREKAWSGELACFGEIGLTGELRPVQHAEDRVREAAKLGFKQILLPHRNAPKNPPRGVQILAARTLIEAMALLV